MRKRIGIYLLIVFFIALIFVLITWESTDNQSNKIRVGAETSGSSPESGATSRLKSAYDSLVTKGANYGDSQPSDWTYASYGAYWNRILYAASWEPGGDATTADVESGKTFYSGNNNRTLKIGTASGFLPDLSLQQYVQYEDASSSDYTGEESIWTNTNTSPATLVWKDARTGLYWARSEPTTLSNSFSSPATSVCDFYLTTPRGSYGDSGTEVGCGIAINTCAVLSLASISGQSDDTNWYLPTQKELKQAYVNGIYNQAGASFTTIGNFWAATQDSSLDRAWLVSLRTGISSSSTKNSANSVRCVRRD